MTAITARDFMITTVTTLPPNTHVFEAIGLLLKRGITGAPVVDTRNNYLGVFTEKCCLRVLTTTATQARDQDHRDAVPTARHFMVKKPITLSSEMNASTAVDHLLKHRHSGALVEDEERRYTGVFSQRTSIRVLVQASYDQTPLPLLRACMDTQPGRITSISTDLLTVAGRFLENSWRLLPVLENGRVIGQISRSDVLRAEHHLAKAIRRHSEKTPDEQHEAGLHDLISDSTVGDWMDRSGRTVTEDADIFTLAHIFRDTPYRRLPVVHDGKLAGLVTRRHVLQAARHLMELVEPSPRSSQVFLSAISDRDESGIM